MRDPYKLRELAIWYREFAERAGNPAVWEARLLTAEELEREADRLDESSTPSSPASLATTRAQAGYERNAFFPVLKRCRNATHSPPDIAMRKTRFVAKTGD
jgi:hypothetical protein